MNIGIQILFYLRHPNKTIVHMLKHGGSSDVEGIVLELGRKKPMLFQPGRKDMQYNNGTVTVIFPAVQVVAKAPKSEIITLDAKSDHMIRESTRPPA